MTSYVPDNDRFVRYVVTDPGGQTEFEIDFPLDDSDYIEVYKDGVLVASDGYTVDLDALTVTLDTAAAQNAIVTLQGRRGIALENAFPLRGDLRSGKLNNEFTNVLYILQELRREADRTIVLNPTEPAATSNVLPLFSQNAGKVIIVNDAGDGFDVAALADFPAAITITLTAAAAGDILRHNGTAWVDDDFFAALFTGSPARGDVPYIDSAGKVALLTGAARGDIFYADANGDLQRLGSAAAGDVLYWDENKDPARLAKGAAGQFIKQGSAVPEWDDAPGWPNNGYITGRYFYPFGQRNTTTTGAVTANRLYAAPFIVSAADTFTRIGLEVTTGSAGNARLGIYNWANGVPTTLVSDLGTVSTGSTGEKEVTISQALDPGIYALAVVYSATPTVVENVTNGMAQFLLGIEDPNSTASDSGVYGSHTYGALPANFPAIADYVTTMTALWLRKA